MSDNILERLKQKQEKIQDMQRQEERRQGRLDQLMRNLKEEFGVDSISAAQEEMTKIAAQNAEDEAKLAQLEKEMDFIVANAVGGK